MANALSRAWAWLTQKAGKVMDTVRKPEGVPWPPEEDAERLRVYARNEQLLVGEHKAVFVDSKEFQFPFKEGREYVVANMLGALTGILTQRLFGEDVELHCQGHEGTEEFLKHLYADSALANENILAATDGSARGDACYKIRYDAAELRIVIETFSAASYFPEFDSLNRRRVVAVNIGQVLPGSDEDEWWLWIERHELREGRGWIVNQVYKCEGKPEDGSLRYHPEKPLGPEVLPQTEALPPEQDTGVDGLLVVHVANKPSPRNRHFGEPDYEVALISLQGELNHRLSQRGAVHDKHVDPFVWGPDFGPDPASPDTVRSAIAGRKGISLGDHKYIVVQPGMPTPPVGALTWDAGLTSVKDELQDVRELFAATAGIELQALVAPEGGGPVSGRALRLSQMKTQATVQSKQRYYGPALQQVLSIATKLATAPGVQLEWKTTGGGAIEAVRPTEIVVEFGDGLPADTMEEIEEQAAMIDAGVQSRRDAIKVIFGLTDADAGEKLAAIDAEAGHRAPEAVGIAATPQPFSPGAPAGTSFAQALLQRTTGAAPAVTGPQPAGGE